jgi:hypothetical protein
MAGNSPPSWHPVCARRHVLRAGLSPLPPSDLGELHSTFPAGPVEANTPSHSELHHPSRTMLVDRTAWDLFPAPCLPVPPSAETSPSQPAEAREAEDVHAVAALSLSGMGLSGCTTDCGVVALILSENRRRANDVDSVGAVIAAAALAAGLVLPPRWLPDLMAAGMHLPPTPAQPSLVGARADKPEGEAEGEAEELRSRAQALMTFHRGWASPPDPSQSPPVSSSTDHMRRPLRSLPLSLQPSPPRGRKAGTRTHGPECRMVVGIIGDSRPLPVPAAVNAGRPRLLPFSVSSPPAPQAGITHDSTPPPPLHFVQSCACARAVEQPLLTRHTARP